MGNVKRRIDESHGSDDTLYNAVCTTFEATAFTSSLSFDCPLHTSLKTQVLITVAMIVSVKIGCVLDSNLYHATS